MNRSLRIVGFASVLTVIAATAACRSGSTPAPPPATSQSTVDASAGPIIGIAGRPTLRPVLEDPRLARARDRERAKDPAGAAQAIEEARTPDLTAADACAWDFLQARDLVAGNDWLRGAAVFARAAAPACPLSPWAHLRGAQALARGGRSDEALAEAGRVSEDLTALRDEVRILTAEIHAAKGNRAAALPLWRAWLVANPHGSRWVDTTVRIAIADLDGVDGPPDAHAQEAFDLATKVVVEAPKLADSVGATAVRARAATVLRAHDPTVSDALGDDARARQAQAWLDLGEPQRALDLTSTVVGPGKKGAAACRAAITRANASAKLKSSKLDAWTDAVASCENDDQLVTALFSGGKAKSAKDPKQAIDWFARLEKSFPSHRLADDARFRGALLVAQSADEGHADRAEQMLVGLPDAYPTGDMRTEALFRVALEKMRSGDWAGARPHLDRIVALSPDDHHWSSAGRAEYFRARVAIATGDNAGARERFVRIVQRYPLSFYMLLSYARLAETDAQGAAAILKEAVSHDLDGTFPSKDHPILRSSGFNRGARLLEVGELDAAKRELAAAGATGDEADPEIVWVVGSLYNQAGYPDVGSSFSRGRLTDFLTHYPEGRWRVPWETAFPAAYEPMVTKSCTEIPLPRPLAWGIMREESSFVADVRSHSNAVGLMQLMGPTAKWVANGTTLPYDDASLKRPEVSIELGVRLLSKLRTTHGHPALAIAAYNGGSGSVDRWMTARLAADLDLFVELVPFEETRNYVKRVLASQAAYAYLYDPPSLKEPLGLPLGFTR